MYKIYDNQNIKTSLNIMVDKKRWKQKKKKEKKEKQKRY